MAEYDEVVRTHYNSVAKAEAAAPSCTMADEIIRETETEVINNFVEVGHQDMNFDGGTDRGLTVADVGCGNGYTLRQLNERQPEHTYFGVEHNDELRALAEKNQAALIMRGDLRDPSSIDIKPGSIDVLICQRVLINLMDPIDQKKGLETCIGLVRPGGRVLFIEVFQSGLDRLNDARAEWGLSPIPAAHHNLPLPDDFFEHPELETCSMLNRHKLSKHYFVTRVMHDLFLHLYKGDAEFIRNSHFVRFFSAALLEAGNYAPLQFVALKKRG